MLSAPRATLAEMESRIAVMAEALARADPTLPLYGVGHSLGAALLIGFAGADMWHGPGARLALPHELRSLTRPIAAKDYWTQGRFRAWITREVFNAVYVDRQRTDDSDPLEPLIQALAQGDSIILFPEGTRGHEELPQPFKAGLYNLALRFPEVVLVPAWIHNVQRLMPKGEVVPVPILCSVTFGEPLALLPGEERGAFLTRAREAVVRLKDA